MQPLIAIDRAADGLRPDVREGPDRRSRTPIRAAHGMARTAPLLACLVLPGCLTRALWREDEVRVLLAHEQTELDVEAIGIVDDAPHLALDAPALQILVQTRGGEPRPLGGDATQPRWLLLEPREQRTAAAIATLLTREPLGPVDSCELEVDWTFSTNAEQYVTARVKIGGDLGQLGKLVLDEAAATRLLAGPRAIDAEGLADAGWSAAVEAAERIDWRLLVPFAAGGRGQVLGGIPADRDGDEAPQLVLRVGSARDCCYLLVPAALAPLLGDVHADPSSLSHRYVLEADCRARILPGPLHGVTMQPPRQRAAIVFTSSVEAMEPRTGWLAKVLLTPLTATADAAMWVLEQGPLAPLRAHEQEREQQYEREVLPEARESNFRRRR